MKNNIKLMIYKKKLINLKNNFHKMKIKRIKFKNKIFNFNNIILKLYN